MKVAVIGSRGIFTTDIGMYISDGDEIVSGGAVGIDDCAAGGIVCFIITGGYMFRFAQLQTVSWGRERAHMECAPTVEWGRTAA